MSMGEPANSNPEAADLRGSGDGENPSGPFSLTRRQWLLRLGEAAVLAGFGGIPPEGLNSAALQGPAVVDPQLASQSASRAALPPGLYDPSADHLTHVLVREQRFVTPPPGSETEYAEPPRQAFAPAFFSPEDFRVVRQLVHLMLNGPGQDATTPDRASAEAVNEVAGWIHMVVSQSAAVREAALKLSPQHRALAVGCYGEGAVQQLEIADPQAVWKAGLAWLHQEAARVSTSDTFLSLTEAQQASLLQKLSQSSGESQPKAEGAGPRFFRLLKGQVIEGYYTSQAGLKELDYPGNAFHGESPGCADK
ncbi:MAG TPA: gluconate 2-dehydrogenase subunit 3 family protein [Terriglobia bacterium]|jgi:hypothetical protein|nr:gluconate 2-dehydrogenase subunit 3 family protein [Terriglobia bacterium]